MSAMMFQRDLVSIRTSHCTWQRCVLGVMFVSALLQIAFASNAARLTDFLPASRAVDDITPAVKNATAEAIAEAENILNSYSDILIGLAIPIGAASTFFGYFLLGPVLFTAAFLIGGGICFIAVRAGLDESKASAWLSIVSMLVGGGLCGFLAVKLLGVGMFALGATLGVTASAALKAVVWSKVFPSSPDAGFIFGAVVLGTIFGVAALSLRKKMLILSTSYAGSFAFFFGIGHFAGHFPNLQDLNNVETGVFEPWAVMYMCLTALFGTAGMFVQLHMTRDKSMPSRYPYSRSRRHERLVESGSDTTADWDGEGEHSNRKLLSSSRASAVQSSQNQLQHAPSDYALADNLDWDSATKLDGTSSATLHKTGDRNTDQHRTENDVRLQIGGPNADI